MKEENDLSKRFKFDFSSPVDFSVDIDKLKRFISNDKDAVIIFYGGEPLLQIDKIKEIMDNIDVPYRMQTNGKLLDKLPIEYLKRIGKILVSLDGDKKRTDYNRGEGTYDKVIENIKKIKSESYEEEIIARMTLSFPDVYEQVLNLVKTGFNSVHWQLDAGFYNDFNKKEFSKFVEEYNKSVTKLVNYWMDEMKKGRVLKFYPFLAIVHSILNDEKTLLRCGSGHAGYSITTDGKIVACPIMGCVEDFVAGDLDNNYLDLKKFDVNGRCDNCVMKSLCGGRCLYWNKAKLWPEEGNNLICETIKHLINEIKSKIEEIKKLIKNNVVKKEDFNHEKYFGPEIIP